MAVANPCLQKKWEEWKRDMEEDRKMRWKERVSRWVDVEMSDEEEEEKDDGGEVMDSEEEGVSEERGENEIVVRVEAWQKEMEGKETEDEEKGGGEEEENSEEEKDNEKDGEKDAGKNVEELEREMDAKKVEMFEDEEDEEKIERGIEENIMGDEDEHGEVTEADQNVDVKEDEKEKENGAVVEEEASEVKEANTRDKIRVEKNWMVDEEEEDKVWDDEQVEDEDGCEEDQDKFQIVQNHQGEQLKEQMRRAEGENLQQNPERKENDQDSLESMNYETSTGCEDECYNFEKIKDEEGHAETKHEDPEKMLNLEQPGRKEGEDSEKLADEESTDDEEAEHLIDETEHSNDEDVVKIYGKADYHTDLFHTLIQFKDSSLLTDLTLSTNDGKSVHVHSPVLAAVSSLIWGHLSRSNGGKDDETSERVHRWSVSLSPEVDHAGLEAVVEFAYTGLISCLNRDTVRQIKNAAQTLGVPRVLRLCTEQEETSRNSEGQKKEERISATEQMMISLRSVRQLWMDRVGCDVVLEALGEPLHVHRVILAASSDYFRGMFTLGMRETHQSSVTLPFLLAPELELLISCSYSGALPLSWKCVFEITSTALQLQYQPALSLCFNFLQQEMNPHSCLDVASFAEAYEMVELLEVAEDFVLRQFQKVARTSKFKDLPARQLLKYLNSHSLCVPSELVVFKAVVAWIQARPKRRLKLAKELMKTVHFPLMTFKEFKEVQSLNMWSDHSLVELYETVFQDFCSNDTAPQSQCRIYLPKESLVLIGGDQISEDLGSRSISRELWFGNSLRNHTGIRKAMEWRKLGEMPEPARFSHEVAVLKGKLYVFGGKKYYGTGDTLNSVYRFDPIPNHWENLAEMQEKRCSFSVVVLDDKIYAIGGHCGRDYIDSVEQYCPTANSWSFTWPLDMPLSAHAAKVLQGRIFISGGRNSDYQSLESTFVYRPETGSCYLANMTTARAHHCMETLGECLYVAGGITIDDNMTVVNQLTCEIYNPASNSWTEIMSLPVPHVGAGSAVLEGKFYVLGGYSQEDFSDTKMVHRYDPAIQRWENMGRMPGPNNDIRASVLCLPPHIRL